jgi:hypothetical protein
MAVVLRNALWARIKAPGEALVVSRGSRRLRLSAHEIEELATELRNRGVRYGTGRELLAHRIAHVLLTQLEAAGESCDDRTHDAVRRSRRYGGAWTRSGRRSIRRSWFSVSFQIKTRFSRTDSASSRTPKLPR